MLKSNNLCKIILAIDDEDIKPDISKPTIKTNPSNTTSIPSKQSTESSQKKLFKIFKENEDLKNNENNNFKNTILNKLVSQPNEQRKISKNSTKKTFTNSPNRSPIQINKNDIENINETSSSVTEDEKET
jgi:hypothetical protein